MLVLLINVDEAFFTHHAEETAPRLVFLGEENSWSVVFLAVDCKRAIRNFLLRVHKECIIHDVFRYVSLHVFGLFARISQ